MIILKVCFLEWIAKFLSKKYKGIILPENAVFIYGLTKKFIESGLLNASFLGSFASTGRGQAIKVAPSEATF